MNQPRHARLSFLTSFAEKYTLLLLNTAGTMVLARLLTPAEVGVYAVGAVLVGLAQALRDFGVGMYVIQEKDLTRDKLRAALGTSVLVAWSLAACVLLASWPAARFYHEPRLETVMQLLSLNFILIPFSAVLLPYLRRHMRFSAIFGINLVQTAGQMLCTILLAWRGFGYLSLAWGAVAGTVAVLLASLCWRPPGMPCWPARRGMRAILSFGSLSTVATVIDEAGVAAPDLIIGKMIGLAEVGIFGKAMGIINVFNQLVTAAISPVIFPLFSAQARDGGDLRRSYLATASYVTALAWPFFGFVAVMAPALVRVLYGNQWDAAIPLIRIICVASALYSMFSMARYLFVAMGAVAQQAKLDAMTVPVRIAAVLLAAPFGLAWVAAAVVAGALFRSGLTYRALRLLTGVRWIDLMASVRVSAQVALVSIAGPLALLLWSPTGSAHPLTHLAVAALTAFALWLAAIMLFRHELADECLLAGRKALTLLTLLTK
jgi:O-antigen/teichoic acid export membrane protein